MSITLSWWLVALVLGGTAPWWIRALSQHWEKRALRRTERIVSQIGGVARPSAPHRRPPQ